MSANSEWDHQNWREDATGSVETGDGECPANGGHPHCSHYNRNNPCCFCKKFYDGEVD